MHLHSFRDAAQKSWCCPCRLSHSLPYTEHIDSIFKIHPNHPNWNQHRLFSSGSNWSPAVCLCPEYGRQKDPLKTKSDQDAPLLRSLYSLPFSLRVTIKVSYWAPGALLGLFPWLFLWLHLLLPSVSATRPSRWSLNMWHSPDSVVTVPSALPLMRVRTLPGSMSLRSANVSKSASFHWVNVKVRRFIHIYWQTCWVFKFN